MNYNLIPYIPKFVLHPSAPASTINAFLCQTTVAEIFAQDLQIFPFLMSITNTAAASGITITTAYTKYTNIKGETMFQTEWFAH
jgi:hypothetical protein